MLAAWRVRFDIMSRRRGTNNAAISVAQALAFESAEFYYYQPYLLFLRGA